MSTAPEMKYIPWKNVEREQLNPQIDREMVVGDKIMLARVLLKKGAHVPLHNHHNEQVTYILEGAFNEEKALELAHMYLHDNAAKLYGGKP